MKKLLTVFICLVMALATSVSALAAELTDDEKYIIEQISSEDSSIGIDTKYVRQFENYFLRDDVTIDKESANEFLKYLKKGMERRDSLKDKNKFDRDEYIYFQKAGTAIGLKLEYDSSINGFYWIDGDGYIVIDYEQVIKNTGQATGDTNESADSKYFSIEAIFAVLIGICIIGVVANLKRWNRKMRAKNQKDYDEDEDEDELEVANRKMRVARMQTFSYRSVKQIVKYFYVPIIMGIIVVVIGFAVSLFYTDIIKSVDSNFINTQPLYQIRDNDFKLTDVDEKDQGDTIAAEDISFPKTGEKYGILACRKLGIDVFVYFGDRGSVLKNGAGTYIGSSIPGAGKTILIGAHDTTYFEGLEKAKKGDEFVFGTSYGIYRYKVSRTEVLDEGQYDDGYDLAGDKEELVLYTCYPFGKYEGDKSQRLFVHLKKVSGPDIEYQEVQ